MKLTGVRFWYRDGRTWESASVVEKACELAASKGVPWFTEEKLGFYGQAILPEERPALKKKQLGVK